VYAAALHQNDDSRSVHTTLYFADADEQRTTSHDVLSLEILDDDLNTQLEELTQSTDAPIREALGIFEIARYFGRYTALAAQHPRLLTPTLEI